MVSDSANNFLSKISQGLLPYWMKNKNEDTRSLKWLYPHPVAFICSDKYGEDSEFLYSNDPSHLMDEWDEVTRLPEYDRWYSHTVPALVQYLDGWQLSCWECDRTVSIYEDEDEDGDDYCEPYSPVFYGQASYCCQLCRDRWLEDREKRKQAQEQVRVALMAKFPNAIDLVINGGLDGELVYANFKFGGKRRAYWRSDKPDSLSISQIDMEAWEKFTGKKLKEVKA